jgi:hypothetical protein
VLQDNGAGVTDKRLCCFRLSQGNGTGVTDKRLYYYGEKRFVIETREWK